MQLKGSFEAASLASILQMLHNDAKTGELKLSSGDREVVIFLSNGSVIFARGNQQGMRVGSLLRSKGIISAAQLQQCLALARKNSTTLGSVLVSENIISRDMLNKVLAKQAQAAIHNVFLWQSGTFEYNDRTSPPEGILESPIDIMGIILEATRRIDEMSVLTKHIETDRVVFRISERFSERDRLKFNAIEWRFLSLIDGTRTVRQLIDESGYEDFAVYKVLNSLISFGLIDRAPDPEPEDDLAQARFSVAALYHELVMETARAAQAELACRAYSVRWPRGAKPINVDKKNLKSMREEAARHQIAMVIAGSIPPITPAHMDIFAGFCLSTPQDVFGHAAMEILKDSSSSEEGWNFLLEALNCFLGRILANLSKRLAPASFARVLRDMRRTVMLLDKYLKGLPEKDFVLQGITSQIDEAIRSIGKINRPVPGAVCISLVVAPDRRNRDACRLLPPEAAPRADMKPLEAPAPPQAQVVEEYLPAEEDAAAAPPVQEQPPLQDEPYSAPGQTALDEDIPSAAAEDLPDLSDDLEQIPDLADLEEVEIAPEPAPARPKDRPAKQAAERKSMAQVLEERYGLNSRQDEPKSPEQAREPDDTAKAQGLNSFSGFEKPGDSQALSKTDESGGQERFPEISVLDQEIEADKPAELDDFPDLADLEELDSIPDLAGMEEIGPMPDAPEDSKLQSKGQTGKEEDGFFGLASSGSSDIAQLPDMEQAIDSDDSFGSLGQLDNPDDNLDDALGNALDELGELDSALDFMEDLSEDDVIGGKKPEEEEKALPEAPKPKAEPQAADPARKPPQNPQDAAQAARQALENARKALDENFGPKPKKPARPLEAPKDPAQPKAVSPHQPSMPRKRPFNEMEEELLELLDEEPVPEDLSHLVMENPVLQSERKPAPSLPKKAAADRAKTVSGSAPATSPVKPQPGKPAEDDPLADLEAVLELEDKDL